LSIVSIQECTVEFVKLIASTLAVPA